MITYLLHGYNVKDGGARTVGRLKYPLMQKGIDTRIPDMGDLSLIDVRFANQNIAKVIASMAGGPRNVIAHSNGALIANYAADAGLQIPKLVLISPALNKNFSFSSNIKSVVVYHSLGDAVLWFSHWLAMHGWGKMGRVGYTGSDKRVKNVDGEAYFGKSLGHSSWFAYPDILQAIAEEF